MHRADLKYLVADVGSRLKIKDKDQTIFDDEFPVLTIPEEIFACATKTDINHFHFIEEPKTPFVPFTPEVCMMTGIKDN